MTGSGTEQDPYIISTVGDLQDMNLDLAAYYELASNIDATATQTQNPTIDRGNWTAATPYLVNDYVLYSGSYYVCIENHTSGGSFEGGKWQLWDSVEPSQYLGFIPVGTSFTGHLDGKNYTITGLYIDRNRPYIGLFAEVGSGGSVQDITLADVDIRGEDYVGALAGVLDTSTVTNCSSSGVVSAYYSTVGGLIGLSMYATVSDSYSSCAVTGILGSKTGGFCGYCVLDTVTNCYATGAVVGNVGADALGGFVGDANGSEISECYATGSVTVEEVRYAGGFAGLIRGNAVIEECYSTGDVTGTNAEYYIGGFVGDVSGSGDTITNCYAMGDASAVTAEDVGGFAGENAGTITDCYSKGSVGGSLNVGGFCGTNDGTITDCFWDTETSGQATSDGGTGKTTSQMNVKSTFTDAGWDFVDVWAIHFAKNEGYPCFELDPLVFPSDAVARVSSIRRVFKPGLYRMEVAFGDLGFDVDVSEAAIKRVSDEVKEPEEPEEKAPEDKTLEEETRDLINKIIKEQEETKLLETMFPDLPTVSGKYTAPMPMPPKLRASASVASDVAANLVEKFLTDSVIGQGLKGLFSR